MPLMLLLLHAMLERERTRVSTQKEDWLVPSNLLDKLATLHQIGICHNRGRYTPAEQTIINDESKTKQSTAEKHSSPIDI